MIPYEWGIQVLRRDTLKTKYVSLHDRNMKGKNLRRDNFLRERLQNIFTVQFQEDSDFANFAVYVCDSLGNKEQKRWKWIEHLEKYQFGKDVMNCIKIACEKKYN